MLQYGHQISGRPLSPSGGSVADTGCSRRIRDVLGAKGNGGSTNEEPKGGAARRGKTVARRHRWRGRPLLRCVCGCAG
jgi:hypothetical protein